MAAALTAFALTAAGCSTFATESLERVDPDPTATAVPTADVPPPEVNFGILVDSNGASHGSLLVSPTDGQGQYLFDADGNIRRIWEGTGEAGAVQLLPDGLLLRTVVDASIDAERATGRIVLLDPEGSLWNCRLNEPWFGGLHLTDEALWVPPDESRGTEPWGSILLAALRVSSVDDATGDTTDEPRFTPVLIEVIPPVDENDEPARAGGQLQRGDCGEYRVLWTLRDHAAELDADQMLAATSGDAAGLSDLAWNSAGRAAAVTVGGLGEVWLVDGMGLADGATSRVLSRWSERDVPSGIAWRDDTLLVVADGDLISADLVAGTSRVIARNVVSGPGGVQALPDGNVLVVDEGAGKVLQLDADGEIMWEFQNPVAGGGPNADTILDPTDVPGDLTTALTDASFYAADFPGLG